MRSDLLAYMAGIARNEGLDLIESNAVDDHVHILMEMKPSHTLSDVVRKIKSNSSRWIHETYPSLNDFAWQSGYAVFSVSESAVEKVRRYIRDQEAHHHKVPFEDEIRSFLEKNQVDFDPAHYLD